MITKTLFFVLLGIFLVLSNPALSITSDKTDINNAEREIEAAWNKLEKIFSKTIDDIKAANEKVKEKGQNVEVIKEKGQKLLDHTKQVYKDMVIDNKNVTTEFQSIVKEYNELKDEIEKDQSNLFKKVGKLIGEAIYAIRRHLIEIANKQL